MQPSSSARQDEWNPPPILSAPLEANIAAAVRMIEENPIDEIRKKTTVVVTLPRHVPAKPRDPRLPPPGSTLERWIGRRAFRVHVFENSFVWNEKSYSSLSKIAQAIVKKPRSGYDFFGLTIPWSQHVERMRGRRINRNTMIDLPSATES